MAQPSSDVAPAAEQLPVYRQAYSDRTAALMATLAAYTYGPAPGEDPTRRLADRTALSSEPGPAPAALVALGLDQITWFHNDMTDGWAFVAEGPLMAVLAFRGTKSAKNWDTNLQVGLEHPRHGPRELKVHRGFLRAFERLAAGRDSLRDKMARLLAPDQPSPVPVYITGHSLGGALAQIASAEFGSDQVAACYTFGSPRVGNRWFDLWVKVPSYRVVNAADIVPLASVFGYRHSGDPRYLPGGVKATVFRYEPGPVEIAWHFLEGVAELFPHFHLLWIADHMIDRYQAKLDLIAANRRQGRRFSAPPRSGQPAQTRSSPA